LSTQPEKFIGDQQMWDKATSSLKESLEEKNLAFKISLGEGAFYGPKIDIKLKDALKRPWQCATIQCDFALPERFDLNYIDENGQKARPVMLHRVLLGSLERFIGALLEHYAGDLPLWLAPEQVRIIPLTNVQDDYAESLKNQLIDQEIRVNIDNRNETLQKRIREAELEKIPYVLIVGKKEIEQNKVSVRKRHGQDLGQMNLEEFVNQFK
ncbi:MAG: threonine--tRNA ligase, partial [Candidatus Omnitrophota bacterium]